jgi:hypothetical protein
MILTGKERYRWLARQSKATRKPRHVFVHDSDFSLCRIATRARDEDNWQSDPARENCRTCAERLKLYPGLQEVVS